MNSTKNNPKQVYMKISSNQRNIIRNCIARQQNSHNIVLPKKQLLDLTANNYSQNSGQKENLKNVFRNSCYSKEMFNPSPQNLPVNKINTPLGQKERNLRSQSTGRPRKSVKDNTDSNLLNMIDQFKLPPHIPFSQKKYIDRFYSHKYSDSKKPRIFSSQDNNAIIQQDDPLNQSENYSQASRSTYKKNQFSNYLEEMNTENRRTNHQNMQESPNSVIIKNHINNLSVQITNGQGLNAELEFSQQNINEPNTCTFKLGSKRPQQPAQLAQNDGKPHNSSSQSRDQSPGQAKFSKQLVSPLLCKEGQISPSPLQINRGSMSSTHERQSRIYALQNIVQNIGASNSGSQFNNCAYEIDANTDSSNTNNILASNAQSTQNKNSRNKFHNQRYQTPLQPVRIYSQNISFSKENPGPSNSKDNQDKVKQLQNSEGMGCKSIQFLQPGRELTDLHLDQNVNIEEMHYQFVEFYQKSKDWLQKIENL